MAADKTKETNETLADPADREAPPTPKKVEGPGSTSGRTASGDAALQDNEAEETVSGADEDLLPELRRPDLDEGDTVYQVLHTAVNEHQQGSFVTAQELGLYKRAGSSITDDDIKSGLDRLKRLGAISEHKNKIPAEE